MAYPNSMYGGMTLKALLENPDLHRAPAVLSGAASKEGKKDVDSPGEIDFTSAFLGPHLWDKTYDDTDFNLEYMDLDEFLSETGIPAAEAPAIDQLVASPPHQPPPTPPILGTSHKLSPLHLHCLPASSSSSSSSSLIVPAAPAINSHRLAATASIAPVITPGNFTVSPKAEKAEIVSRIPSPSTQSTGSTPPLSPLPVLVDFKVSEQDVVLSSVPGQDLFDPTSHNFSEDDLKPQPMIKKSRKVFVPEDLKDDRYWARRKKNNHAAKRSRDARRIKENQIAMRAAYLEKENATLREELEKLRHDNARMKHKLSKYESTGGPPAS